MLVRKGNKIQVVSKKEEIFGFGKKKKNDSGESWETLKDDIKNELERVVQSLRNVYDWHKTSRGDVVEDKDDYLLISTLYGTDLQVLDGVIIVSSLDAGEKKFSFDNMISDFKSALLKAVDFFKKLTKKQGELNSKKGDSVVDRWKEKDTGNKLDNPDWLTRRMDPYTTGWI